MEVALRYKLLTLITRLELLPPFTLFTLITQFKQLWKKKA